MGMRIRCVDSIPLCRVLTTVVFLNKLLSQKEHYAVRALSA